MLSRYGRVLCIIAVCCSRVAARPEYFVPRSFSNTTSSSTIQTTLSLSSIDSTTSSSSTGSTNLPSISTSITSRSSTSNRVPLVTPATASGTVVTTSPASTINSSTSSTQLSISVQLSSPSSISSSSSFSVTSTQVTSGTNSSRATTQQSSSHANIIPSTTPRRSSSRASTSTHSSISTTTPACSPITSIDESGSRCISYCHVATSFVFATNTTETVTQLVTIFRNSTSLSRYRTPGPTTSQTLPPQPCITPTTLESITTAETLTGTVHGTATGTGTSPAPSQPAKTTIVSYVTSKTTVTNFVTAPSISFGGPGVQDKSTVSPTADTQPQSVTPVQPQSLQQATTPSLAVPESNPTVNSSPASPGTASPGIASPGTASPGTASPGADGLSRVQGPIQTSAPTVDVNGVPVIPGNSIIIGSTTLSPNVQNTVATVDGKTFTVNPSQIIAQGTTIARPTPNQGAAPTSDPAPTVVNGVTIAIGSSIAILGSSTFQIGPGALPTTTVINGQTVSIGPGGVAIGSTTLTPADSPTPAPQTQITTINGVAITEIGSTVILGGQTFTVGPQAKPTTMVVNGQTVSIGPSGVVVGSTTLTPAGFPTPAPQTQTTTINGVAITEIGSTVILGGQTFTVGPQAKPTTIVVNGQTFSIGPGGVGSQSTTLFAPPNPTQVITTAGLTLTEIGSSLVVLDGTTFTLGAQATPTTKVLNGATISIGPGGIGIAGLTTIAPPSRTAATPQTKTITAGGITFSEIGSTLVVIGSSTFTIGPGATPTTDVYNGVTISIGPGGVGFPSTTVPYAGGATATATAAATGVLTVTTSGAVGGFGGRSWWMLAVCGLAGVWAVL